MSNDPMTNYQFSKKEFEEFYRESVEKLRRFVAGKISIEEDREEVVQDVFLAFLDSLPLFRARSSLKTFLYAIAKHEVADYWRRRYAKRALKLVPIIRELAVEPVEEPREMAKKINKIYRRLLPEQVKLLKLKYEENLSVREMAEKLKLTFKAVESKLFRARKEFQVLYEEENI